MTPEDNLIAPQVRPKTKRKGRLVSTGAQPKRAEGRRQTPADEAATERMGRPQDPRSVREREEAETEPMDPSQVAADSEIDAGTMVEEGDAKDSEPQQILQAVVEVIDDAPQIAERAAHRVRTAGDKVRTQARTAGVRLWPGEAGKLVQAEQRAERSVHEYLQEIDAAKAQLEAAQRQYDELHSFAGRIDRRIQDAKEKRVAAQTVLDAAKTTYGELLAAAKITDTGKRAVHIHEARNRFAELEARMNGREHDMDESTRSHASRHTDDHTGTPATRFDRLKQEFIAAKHEYMGLRAEIASMHLNAFLHEQAALTDARALEVTRARAGKHLEAESRAGLEKTEQAALAVERGLLKAYQAWDALGQITVARVTGWQPETRLGKFIASTNVRTGISLGMVGAGVWIGGAFEVSAATSALAATALRKSLGTLTAGRGAYDLIRGALLNRVDTQALHREDIADMSDEDLAEKLFALESKAVLNGVQPSTLPGYQQLRHEYAQRTSRTLSSNAERRQNERRTPTEQADACKRDLKELIFAVDRKTALMREKARGSDTRIKVVSGALGAFLSSGVVFEMLGGASDAAGNAAESAKSALQPLKESLQAALHKLNETATDAVARVVKTGVDTMIPQAHADGMDPEDMYAAVQEGDWLVDHNEEGVGDSVAPNSTSHETKMPDVDTVDTSQAVNAQEGVDTPEAGPEAEMPQVEVFSVSTDQLRDLFKTYPDVPRKAGALLALIQNTMGEKGAQIISMPEFGFAIAEAEDGTISAYGFGDAPHEGIVLGNSGLPNMGADMGKYRYITDIIDKAINPAASATADTSENFFGTASQGSSQEPPLAVAYSPEQGAGSTVEPVHSAPVAADLWTVDPSQPSGLFAEDYAHAAKTLGRKSFAEIIRTTDDAIDHGIDLAANRLAPELPVTDHSDTLPSAGQAIDRAANDRMTAQELSAEAADQESLWRAPEDFTPEELLSAEQDLADGRLDLPHGMSALFQETRRGYEIVIQQPVPKEVATQLLFREDEYKDIIRQLVREYKQELVNPEMAIAHTEEHAVRLASLLQVRDYMVDHGLNQTPQFEALRVEINEEVDAVSKYGHIIYDDPYYGQPSQSQKVDEIIEWGHPLENIHIERQTHPFDEE